MKQIALRSLLFAASLSPTLALAARPDTATPDAAAMWTQFLAHANLNEALADIGALTDVGYDGQSVDADACREHDARLKRLVDAAPISVAAHRAAYLCADATGRTDVAEREMQMVALLSRHALAGAGTLEIDPPIQVLTPADAFAIVLSSGMEVAYDYYAKPDPGRYFPLVLAAFDKASGTERHLAFDFVGAMVATNPETPNHPYPAMHYWTARAYLDGGVKSSTISALDITAVQTGRGISYADRVAKFRSVAAQGGVQTLRSWVLLCGLDKFKTCDEGLQETLLARAESREAMPLVFLALAQVEGIGTKADPEAGWALLDAAQRRWPEGALSEFGVMWTALHFQSDTVPAPLQSRLDKAQAQGNRSAQRFLVAHRMVAAARAGKKAAAPAPADVAFLSSPQMNRMGVGFAVLAAEAGARGDGAAHLAWMQKAADAGQAEAQLELGIAKLYGTVAGITKDAATGEALLEKAAFGGQARPGLILAYVHARRGDYKAMEGWLQGAVMRLDGDAMLALAELYSQEREGLFGGMENALDMYKSMLGDSDLGPKARRSLAALAIQGRGMAKDPAQAREWLLADAKAGDVKSQTRLGLGYLKGEVGPRDEAEGERWLQRAIEGGDEDAVTSWTQWLYYDRNTAQSRAQAMAQLAKAIDAGNDGAINNYAWILCTTPDKTILDPARGLALLSKLNAFASEDPGTRDTQAACLAANGRFAEAAAMQETAAREMLALSAPWEIAKRKGKPFGFERRLALYREGKRYEEFEHNE